MKTINEDIKNHTFQRVYLLYGPESYLRLYYLKRLSDAAVPPEDTMNRGVFSGADIAEGEIIDLAETLPFFSDRRVIILKDTGFFKTSCELLPDYIKKLPEYLTLIFSEEEADKRSRLYKAVKEAGHTAEFAEQDENTLMRWGTKLFSNAGLSIGRDEMAFLLVRTGPSMGRIALEADKVINYCKGRTQVTKEDISEVVSNRVDNHIFDMISAVTAHNRKKALSLYADLLALKEPPMRILFLLARQYNQLLIVKELAADGNDASLISSKTGVQGFIVRKYLQEARNFTKKELEDNVKTCIAFEEDVKNGRISDRLSVELILTKFS